MTMKSQHPVETKAKTALQWQVFPLPIGLQAAVLKESAEGLDLPLPDPGADGFILTFINYKGDLRIKCGEGPQEVDQGASPGLSLLTRTGRPMVFHSAAPIHFAALALYIPKDWAGLFFRENAQFHKVDQVLEEGSNVITCRLGRRQMSLFS